MFRAILDSVMSSKTKKSVKIFSPERPTKGVFPPNIQRADIESFLAIHMLRNIDSTDILSCPDKNDKSLVQRLTPARASPP